MSALKKVVIGLLCLALIVSVGVSIASRPASFVYEGDPGGGTRPGSIVYEGDPGGGTRPGSEAPVE